MITIANFTLSRLVAQTKPHMGTKCDVEALQSISFDHDGTYLYAMATNRFTIAVSRTQVTGGDDTPWHAIVHRTQLPEVAAAVELLDADTVQLERTDDQLIFCGKPGHRVAVDLSPFTKAPLDWRKILLPSLEKPASPTQMAMDPKFFEAWKDLPKPLRMWSTGEGCLSLIVAADFLGAQMPLLCEGGDVELRRELDAWTAVKREEPAPAAA